MRPSEPSPTPPPNHPIDAFTGTATYYARYRVPYPQPLIDDLRQQADITGNSRLIDLGCGTGRVTLALAPYVREIWAIDQESEMIDVGREEARSRGITNIRWLVGRAEDLDAPSESFDLITIGEAFHRLDQNLILLQALSWLTPDGFLVTMGAMGLGRGHEPWQKLVADIKKKWKRKTPTSSCDLPRGTDYDQKVLQQGGFRHIKNYECTHLYIWTVESIMGNLYSTSGYSKYILKHNAEVFEKEIRDTLLSYNPQGRYSEMMHFGYTLARRARNDMQTDVGKKKKA